MKWRTLALLCVLVIVPASAQTPEREPSFWLKRIYGQVDGLVTKFEDLKESQAQLDSKLTESRYAQNKRIDALQSEIEDVEGNIASIESAMENANIQRQTTRDRVWSWLERIVAPLVGLLIAWLAKIGWDRMRAPPSNSDETSSA